MVIIVLCGITLSWPRRVVSQKTILKNGIDIVFALDISYSMEANDLTPNRLEAAKNALQEFIKTRKSDRVGLVLFAWKPFISIPLTFDYHLFEQTIEAITTTTIDQWYAHLQWTAVWDALLNSITVLEKWRDETIENNKREQIIVLFTDWEANVGVDPKIIAQLAAEKNIKIYPIWIGSDAWWVITTQTAFGTREQRVRGVDQTSLREIARITNWLYARADQNNTLQESITAIGALSPSEIRTEQKNVLTDATIPFVIMLIFCMVCLLIIERKTIL